MTVKDDEVIVAQATAQGAGAIGMIRVSGVHAVAVVDAVARLGSLQKLAQQPSHTIHYGWIVDALGQHVDQVLFLLMLAPKTFTGQDVVEITCHNNQLLIEQIISLLIDAGARLAQQGEFTRRSVLSNKIDLVQAEAINELIHAQTSQALKQSLQQLEGSFSSFIAKIEQQLLHIVALCEASFEFLDEEITFDDQIKERINTVVGFIEQSLASFDKRLYVTQGVRIALVGSVNAGKSSLFNVLVDKKRAIVTDIAGTTRDTIESGIYRQGTFMTFIDTAGLRDSDDVVEKIGIDKSFQEVASADIILMVFDASADYSQDELAVYESIAKSYQHKIVFVQNKIDAGSFVLPFLRDDQYISISVATRHNIDLLRNVIDYQVEQLLTVGQSPFLMNKRHHDLLLQVNNQMHAIKNSMLGNIEYELLVVHISDALSKLSEVTGKTVTEDALNAIFREFCVGK